MKFSFLNDLMSLFFPRTCLACGKNLLTHENLVCEPCLFHLPRTRFHLEADNPVVRAFWGKVPLVHATAFLYYAKGNRVQRLIHALKYKGEKELGPFLGKIFAEELRAQSVFPAAEAIVAVPLHPTRLKKRGYNQGELIAEGLSEVLGIPLLTGIMIRSRATETQTRKSRYDRWKNVEDIIHIKDASAITGKNLLLVDDVLTTGSTMEACIQALIQIPGVSVSVAAVGYASR
ncbi:MAG: phosphoribosyltransferase family protein [Bacteroidota bacterium]